MPDKKLIAVVGATGSQGGGLVRAILDHPNHEFAVRAITRSAQSAKARELAAAGAELSESPPQQRSTRTPGDGAPAVAGSSCQ